MKRTTAPSRSGGYALQEIIVGLVILGVALIPIVKTVAQLPSVAQIVGVQNRTEAWRSAVDSVVLAGIDPASTQLLDAIVGGNHMAPGIKRTAVPATPTDHVTQLTLLYDEFSATAETRVVAAGFEIGASASATGPTRTNPLPPLPPRKLPAPVITSPLNPVVPVSDLADSGIVSAPFIATIVAAGSDVVVLRKDSPNALEARGPTRASLSVTAVDLAFSVRGFTWAEYAGTQGDVAISLPGNRTRWLVKRGNQTEVVDPSDLVPFTFGVAIGRPIFRLGSEEHASGSVLPIDIFQALSIESGRTTAEITFPTAVQRAFGNEWNTIAPAFAWDFGGVGGNSNSGDTSIIFGTTARRSWQSSQLLSARPSSFLSGLSVSAGSWRLNRHVTQLLPPERVAGHYDGTLDAPGYIEFSAPVLGEVGVRMGRPEFNGIQSTRETLSVAVVP